MNRKETIDPIEGALIAAGRIEEQLEEVTALIYGAIGVLPDESLGTAGTILRIASDFSGDTGNLASLRRSIEALKEGRP